jgi:hypothetical protein
MGDTPAAPKQAIVRGHAPEFDATYATPAGAVRWLCSCGATVMDFHGRVYGSATEQDCHRAVTAR